MTSPAPAAPTPAAPNPAPAANSVQYVLTPLNAYHVADLKAAGSAFDTWLKDISGGALTLDRLAMAAGALPVIGNVIALADVLSDIATIVQKKLDDKDVDFMEWVSLGINLVGIVPGAGNAARTAFRPVVQELRQQVLRGAKNIGDSLIEAFMSHLWGTMAGELETFVTSAQAKLKPLLDEAVGMVHSLVDELILPLEACLGQPGAVARFKAKLQPKKPRQAKDESTFAAMLGALSDAVAAGEGLAAEAVLLAAQQLVQANPVVRDKLAKAIAAMRLFKGDFANQVHLLQLPDNPQSIFSLLARLAAAIASRKKAGSPAPAPAKPLPAPKASSPSSNPASPAPATTATSASAGKPEPTKHTTTVSAEGGGKVDATRKGAGKEAGRNQAKPEGPDPNACKQCPASLDSKKSINFATGSESFTHTDFALAAPLPIEWSRTYHSHLAAFDKTGPLGARWVNTYTTRVDIEGRGLNTTFIYHGSDGRSHRCPGLKVGTQWRHQVEDFAVMRISEDLLLIDHGKPLAEGEESPWRETYERVPGPTSHSGHFRLVMIQAQHGAKVRLAYQHEVAGGQALSEIVSLQGTAVMAHIGLKPDTHGRIQAIWEIRDGQPGRVLAQYQHDEHGDLVRAHEENGAAWDYQYRRHLVTRYTDRTGRGHNLAYDHHGDDETVSGNEQRAPRSLPKAVHEWADDGSFDLQLRWSDHVRLTWVTDALGGVTWYYYDIHGYAYRVIHPDEREEWFYRDAASNVVRHVHPDGSADTFAYDHVGNRIRHERADGSSVVHFEYDAGHRLTGILDANNGVWRRRYDQRGHLVEETDPLGHPTEYAYDQAGRPIQVTDAKGGIKKLGYTASGQLASYTDCSNRTTRWEYDDRGRLSRQIDAAGQATRYVYTPLNAETLLQARHAEASATPGNVPGTFPGNFPGQLASVVRPDQTAEHLVHDAEGRLLLHTDALERRTAFRYSRTGQVEQRTDANGHRLNYRWDAQGRLTELRNENDQPYRFEYDAVGKLLAEVGFDAKRTDYAYNEGSGRLEAVSEGGVTTRLRFDKMGRLAERRATAPGRNEQVETFAYRPDGQLAEARNDSARLQFFYDKAGNLTREHHGYLQRRQTAVWQHRYNELNQRVGTTRPDGHTVEWLTYGSGHVHGLVLDGEEVVGFERDQLHREVHRTQGNGLQLSQAYDQVGRLLEQQLARRPLPAGQAEMGTGDFAYRSANGGSHVGTPAAILRRYTYDRAGQLAHIEDNRRGRMEYRYDPVGRLLESTGGTTSPREVFAFDPAGNIVDRAAEGSRDAMRSTRPALPTVLDNLIKEYAGTRYRYDERGNMVERLHNGQRSTFEWDAFNRMTQAVTAQGRTDYTYDAFGRRIAKHHQAPSTRPADSADDSLSTETLYGWDGDTLAFETTGRRDAGGAGSTVHYIHEAGSFVPLVQARRREAMTLAATTDVPALRATNAGRYDIRQDPLWNGDADIQTTAFTKEEIAFYQCDHLGTPQELTDHEGNIAWVAQQKAWGETKVVISDAAKKAGLTNPIRFQGQYFDDETGLHYNRHRYYDPASGRFASKDPIGIAGGDNFYEYGPNATEWVDPLGLQRRGGQQVSGGKPALPGDYYHDYGQKQSGSQTAKPTPNGKKCETVRVRHYTGASRAKAIMESGVIKAGEHNRVYLEPASKKPMTAQKVAEAYRIPVERGRAYVETDVCKDRLDWKVNPLYGTPELTVKGDLPLDNSSMMVR